jgi:hypothetical protein
MIKIKENEMCLRKKERRIPKNHNLVINFMLATSEGITIDIYLPIGFEDFDKLCQGSPRRASFPREWAWSSSGGGNDVEVNFNFGPFTELGQIHSVIDYFCANIGNSIDNYDEKQIKAMFQRVALHRSVDKMHEWINQGLYD